MRLEEQRADPASLQNSFYEDVINSMRSGLVITNAVDLRIVSLNRAGEAILVASKLELNGSGP